MIKPIFRTAAALGLAALSLTGTAALAADPKAEAPAAVATAAPAAAATPGVAKKTKRYCTQTFATGSRIGKMTCLTRAEWLREGFDPLNP